MKVYELTIKPRSGFGTPLKGDTIFGHFCWQLAYDPALAAKPLETLLAEHATNPFVIFSSAWPRFCVGTAYHYAFKTPDLPLDALFQLPTEKRQVLEKRKDYKAKKWMLLKEGERVESLRGMEFLDYKELEKKACDNMTDEARKQVRKVGARNFMTAFSQPHNTINRLTGTTGEGPFAPYVVKQQVFYPYPETEMVLFVGIEESLITVEQVKTALERIGCYGFGKDASTGLGRFEVDADNEINLAEMGSDLPNACYTLAPCVPEQDTFEEMFFAPFTRFGRHGDVLAKSGNPFKNPVIMADEGGIFKPRHPDVFTKPYIGRAVTNISKAQPNAVAQGYSLYIPVRLEV